MRLADRRDCFVQLSVLDDVKTVVAAELLYRRTNVNTPARERIIEREAHGAQLYGSLGIAQTDATGRLMQYKKNFEFFNAPVALFITIDRRLGPANGPT